MKLMKGSKMSRETPTLYSYIIQQHYLEEGLNTNASVCRYFTFQIHQDRRLTTSSQYCTAQGIASGACAIVIIRLAGDRPSERARILYPPPGDPLDIKEEL